MENTLIPSLEQLLALENIEVTNQLNDSDRMFYSEFYEMLESLALNPFDLFKELTYFYVRYSGAIIPYKHIPSFLEEKPENVILFLISYFRTICAYNLMVIYEEVLFQSQTIISNAIRSHATRSNKIISLLKNTTFDMKPEEKFINIEASLCTFAEYMSFLKRFIETSKFSEEDLEFLLAVSIYFSYYNPEDSTKWDECSSLVVKVFNSYTNDALRKDSFLNMNGIALYELFRMNEMLLRKNLRDLNLWVLAGYIYRLDTLQREWDDIKESVDREEFNSNHLLKCKESIEEANNIYLSFQFCNWNVNIGNIKQASNVLIMYTWAEYKIGSLKD